MVSERDEDVMLEIQEVALVNIANNLYRMSKGVKNPVVAEHLLERHFHDMVMAMSNARLNRFVKLMKRERLL